MLSQIQESPLPGRLDLGDKILSGPPLDTQHPMTTVYTRTSQSTYTCTLLSLPQLSDPFHVGLTGKS